MNKKTLLVMAAAGVLVLQQVSAAVIGTDLGTANPPASLGGYTVNPYDPGSIGGADYYANIVNGNGAPGGTGSWATWGQNYTGRVYVTLDGSKTLTLSLSGVSAVYLYMEPNVFSDFQMTATDSSGVFVTTTINGSYGSAGVGFHTDTVGAFLTSISVTCTDPTGFAIGEFGIDDGSFTGTVGVPDAGSSLALLGLGMVGLGGLRRRLSA